MTTWNISRKLLVELTHDEYSMLYNMFRQLNVMYDNIPETQSNTLVLTLLNSFKSLVCCWSHDHALIAYAELCKWEDMFLNGEEVYNEI